MRKIAIIGRGFAGLSLAWQLLCQTKSLAIDLFEDPESPSASSIATGLLHFFHGAQARVPPQGQEAYLEAENQLEKVGADTPLFRKEILLRPARNRMQELIFAKRARHYPSVAEYRELPCKKSWGDQSWGNQSWGNPCEEEDPCQEREKNQGLQKALWIHNAYLVDSQLYLKQLSLAIEPHCHFIEKRVSPQELEPLYDRVVLAAGSHSLAFLGEERTLWSATYGQLATLALSFPPPFALNGKTYLVPSAQQIPGEKKPWIVGATFEPFDSESRNSESRDSARSLLWQESQKLWPLEIGAGDLVWQSGCRLAGPNHLPECRRLGEKLYLFTGLGSKGLLYAAWMAKKLAWHLVHGQADDPFSYRPSSSSS